jgi:hypothetical protein
LQTCVVRFIHACVLTLTLVHPNPYVLLQEPGGPWETDGEIADERYVAATVKGKGVVVFSACSHAGQVR